MPKRKRPLRHRRAAVGETSDPLPAALELHRTGKFAQAERAYKKILAGPCDSAVVQHLLGRLYWQTDRQLEAIESLRSALAIREDYAEALLDLANMLSGQGQLEQARACLLELVRLRPIAAMPRNNLGVVLEDLGEYHAALDAYRNAQQLDVGNVSILCNLARVQTHLGALEAAVSAYRMVVESEPTHVAAWRCLASLLRRLDRPGEARNALAAWLKLEPNHPVPQHLLTAYDPSDVPPRASDQYVRQVFDQFAATFETDLQRLDYRGPQLIQQGLMRELADTNCYDRVLDAGCGTGLCGSVLRPYAHRLIGVDLSPKMLAVADQRSLYDELVEAELCNYLTQHETGFELIACADTFGYFGDLAPVFAAARRALRPAGKLIATIEIGQVPDQPGYRLQASGRYTHNVDYVLQCCAAARLEVRDRSEATLRLEAEQPVRAMVLTAVVLL